MQTTDAAASAVAAARVRVGLVSDDLDRVRAGALEVAGLTAWRSHSAAAFRAAADEWREDLDARAARVAVLDDELRLAAARIEAARAAAVAG